MKTVRSPQFPLVLCVVLGGLVTGCGVPTESGEESAAPTEELATSEVQQELILPEDCPPEADPCECALAGTVGCKDPDGDGLANRYDNCDNTYNPDQANCDGDSAGDACDSVNGTQTRSTATYYDSTSYGYYQYCYQNQSAYQATTRYSQYETVTTTYCAGPQAGQTTTTTNFLGYTYYSCYQYAGYCSYNNISYQPGPWC